MLINDVLHDVFEIITYKTYLCVVFFLVISRFLFSSSAFENKHKTKNKNERRSSGSGYRTVLAY